MSWIETIKYKYLAKKGDKEKADEKEKDTKGNKDKEHQGDGDLEKSEKSSNISGFFDHFAIYFILIWFLAASVNEDLRQLKDFKALISEKTVPKSIKILKRTVWILGIVLIIITGYS